MTLKEIDDFCKKNNVSIRISIKKVPTISLQENEYGCFVIDNLTSIDDFTPEYLETMLERLLIAKNDESEEIQK